MLKLLQTKPTTIDTPSGEPSANDVRQLTVILISLKITITTTAKTRCGFSHKRTKLLLNTSQALKTFRFLNITSAIMRKRTSIQFIRLRVRKPSCLNKTTGMSHHKFTQTTNTSRTPVTAAVTPELT